MFSWYGCHCTYHNEGVPLWLLLGAEVQEPCASLRSLLGNIGELEEATFICLKNTGQEQLNEVTLTGLQSICLDDVGKFLGADVCALDELDGC